VRGSRGKASGGRRGSRGREGQVFLPGAVDRAYELTQGQPWLVNALARQLTEVLVQDPRDSIAAAKVDSTQGSAAASPASGAIA
jgi:hypothetical protein